MKEHIPESNLERLARTILPEQVKALIGIFYGKEDALLLFDKDYRFVLATRTAELKLGYGSNKIRHDSTRLQPEIFKRLNEICVEEFTRKGRDHFELNGVAYASSDEKTSFLLNIQVTRIHGGAVVNLRKVAKQPYQKQEEDIIVAAPTYIDNHWDRKDIWHGETFEGRLNAAYLSAAQGKRVIIDLSKTRDIGFEQVQKIIAETKDRGGIIFLNARPAVYELLHKNGEGIPAERLAYTTKLVLTPKPA